MSSHLNAIRAFHKCIALAVDNSSLGRLNLPIAQDSSTSGLGFQFEAVDFAYPQAKDTMVLQNISFTIDPGAFVAVVGYNGSVRCMAPLPVLLI